LPDRPELIDEKARRLAEFFNGEVVQLDGPLPGLSEGEGEAAA
jgi:DNA polymerase III subunit gamma/tau